MKILNFFEEIIHIKFSFHAITIKNKFPKVDNIYSLVIILRPP